MKLTRTFAATGILMLSLTACGGAATTESAPKPNFDVTASVDAGTWFKDNCQLKGWRYDKAYGITQMALIPSEKAKDKPKTYDYDEKSNEAKESGEVTSAVCWTSEKSGETVNAKDSDGKEIKLIKVGTPNGDVYVTRPNGNGPFYYDSAKGSFKSKDGGVIAPYNATNEHNDWKKIQVNEGDAPDKCDFTSC